MARHHGPTWSRRRFLTAGAAAGAGVTALSLAGCSLNQASTPANEGTSNAKFGGNLLDPPFEKPDVTFVDQDGRPYDLRSETKGKLTVLFFGFTHCPDVCPVYLNTMNSALGSIGGGPGSNATILFCSVDTKRDTPPVLKTYLSNINPDFVGLTAEPEVINRALGDLRLPEPTFGKPDRNGDYEVGHASYVTVFSKDDVAHRMYPSDTRQSQWARDLPRLARGRYR